MRNVRACEYRSGSLPISSAARSRRHGAGRRGGVRARVGGVVQGEVEPEHHRRAGQRGPLAEDRQPCRGEVGHDSGRLRRAGRVPPRLVGRVAADADRRRAVAGRGERAHQPREDRVGPRAAEVARRGPVLHREACERARDPRAGDVAERAPGDDRVVGRVAGGLVGRLARRDGDEAGARPAVLADRAVRRERHRRGGTCQLPSIPVATVASVSQGVAAPATRRWTVTLCTPPAAPGPTAALSLEVDPERVARSARARASARRRRSAGPTASPCTRPSSAARRSRRTGSRRTRGSRQARYAACWR